MNFRDPIINFFERAINLTFRKLGIKLKLSDLLRIATVKVTQFEKLAEKITIIEVNEVQDISPQDKGLPCVFDLSVYRELNSDLEHVSDDELKAHYDRIGIQEGRACSRIRCRNDFIGVISNFKGERLEIGPFCSPILIKDSRTYFSDYLDTAELQIEAIKQKHNPDDVPVIDFPTKEVTLDVVVGTKRFFVVVSCHNIEHYPDLVTHLQEVNAVLMKGGYYFLVIPDKRFSAHYYQENSMLPEVLAAYAEKRKLPNIENVLKSFEFITHSYPQRHWMNDHGANTYYVPKKASLLISLEQITQSVQRKEYNDIHCWRFTPQSFIEIIDSLKDLKLINFQPVRVFPTLFGSNEFFVVLRNIG